MPSARAFLRAPGAFCLALARLLRTVVVVGFAAFALRSSSCASSCSRTSSPIATRSHRTLAQELGQPVEIATLDTGWDGWNPKLVVQGFRVRDGAGSGALPLLDLPEVELIVSWTSLPLLELRLKELVIERPRLAIRRDRAGHLQVAGIEFDPEQTHGDSSLTDWILRQREIVIRDALITWDDDLRNAPQLVLDRVQFRLENRFGRHRFGLKGTPPAELAAPIDLRGDLKGVSLRDWQRGGGPAVRAARLRRRRPRGANGCRCPCRSRAARARCACGSSSPTARRARSSPTSSSPTSARTSATGFPSSISRICRAASAGARRPTSARSSRKRSRSRRRRASASTRPTSSSRCATGAGRPSGQIEFDQLQLEPLVALAANLPLAARVRADLARFAPRGTLVHGRLRWEGDGRGADRVFRDRGIHGPRRDRAGRSSPA